MIYTGRGPSEMVQTCSNCMSSSQIFGHADLDSYHPGLDPSVASCTGFKSSYHLVPQAQTLPVDRPSPLTFGDGGSERAKTNQIQRENAGREQTD